MVALNHTVDPNNAGVARQTLPPGTYDAEITDVVVKTAREKTNNQYLEITFKTSKGNVWHKLNLWNTNPQAVEIAYRELNAIGMAVGLAQINDSDQLLARKCKITVDHRQSEQGKTFVDVVEFAPAGGAAHAPAPAPQAAAPAPQPQPAPAPQPAPQQAAPWAS